MVRILSISEQGLRPCYVDGGHKIIVVLPRLQKKPVDFDHELKIGDVRYYV